MVRVGICIRWDPFENKTSVTFCFEQFQTWTLIFSNCECLHRVSIIDKWLAGADGTFYNTSWDNVGAEGNTAFSGLERRKALFFCFFRRGAIVFSIMSFSGSTWTPQRTAWQYRSFGLFNTEGPFFFFTNNVLILAGVEKCFIHYACLAVT